MGRQSKILPARAISGLRWAGSSIGNGWKLSGGFGPGHGDDLFRQFLDGEFAGIADVDRTGNIVAGIHQADHAFDQIAHVTEGPGLFAVAEDGDVPAPQGLNDEVGDHAAIVRTHAGAVGVEYPRDLDAGFVLTVIIEKQGFRAALAFVVTGPRPDGIDRPPVGLGCGWTCDPRKPRWEACGIFAPVRLARPTMLMAP